MSAFHKYPGVSFAKWTAKWTKMDSLSAAGSPELRATIWGELSPGVAHGRPYIQHVTGFVLRKQRPCPFSRTGPYFSSSGWEDSNFRPPAPHAGAIPGYATSRKLKHTPMQHNPRPSRPMVGTRYRATLHPENWEHAFMQHRYVYHIKKRAWRLYAGWQIYKVCIYFK